MGGGGSGGDGGGGGGRKRVVMVRETQYTDGERRVPAAIVREGKIETPLFFLFSAFLLFRPSFPATRAGPTNNRLHSSPVFPKRSAFSRLPVLSWVLGRVSGASSPLAIILR